MGPSVYFEVYCHVSFFESNFSQLGGTNGEPVYVLASYGNAGAQEYDDLNISVL